MLSSLIPFAEPLCQGCKVRLWAFSSILIVLYRFCVDRAQHSDVCCVKHDASSVIPDVDLSALSARSLRSWLNTFGPSSCFSKEQQPMATLQFEHLVRTSLCNKGWKTKHRSWKALPAHTKQDLTSMSNYDQICYISISRVYLRTTFCCSQCCEQKAALFRSVRLSVCQTLNLTVSIRGHTSDSAIRED